MPFLEHGEIRVYYEVHGRGRPLLFIHDWNTSSLLFKMKNLRSFADEMVILVDLPGFGKSPPLARVSFPALVSILDHLLRSLGVESAVVMGTCLGAIIALDFAIRRPRCVRTLVLIEIMLDFPFIMRLLFLPLIGFGLHWFFVRTRIGLRIFSAFMFRNWAIYKRIFTRIARRAEPSISVDYLRMLERYSTRDHYRRAGSLRMPVLVVNGAHTRASISRTGRRLASACVNGRHVVIEAGHLTLLERPVSTSEAVLSFLAEVESGRGAGKTPIVMPASS
jgi:pimeloyl-ACP methyl ester carboxylesterase